MSKENTPDTEDVKVADQAADDVPAVEHTAAPDIDDAADIAADWADAYPPGSELFVGEFGPEDFETGEYAEGEYPDGATVAVKRCIKKPPPGWIRKHAGMGDLERTFALLELHACPEALDVLDALTADAWNEYVERWGEDGGLVSGNSRRAARRAARRKTR
ncbi:hypothetical protein ACM0CA_22675 [Mycobacteroides abscessus subsp. abscessus]|uniref:hypothetical protein n=1 Tax=Mycobacteroides abscessus TaxID=36809 RepID=UPI0039EE3267